MIRKTVAGIVASLAVVVMVVGTSAFATDLTNPSTGSVTISGTPTMGFKTSPNVFVAYHSAGTGVANTSYVAASMHSQGDKAYGVDPDYTGMYVQAVPTGSTSVLNFPTTSAAGSSGDFGSSNWTPK